MKKTLVFLMVLVLAFAFVSCDEDSKKDVNPTLRQLDGDWVRTIDYTVVEPKVYANVGNDNYTVKATQTKYEVEIDDDGFIEIEEEPVNFEVYESNGTTLATGYNAHDIADLSDDQTHESFFITRVDVDKILYKKDSSSSEKTLSFEFLSSGELKLDFGDGGQVYTREL